MNNLSNGGERWKQRCTPFALLILGSLQMLPATKPAEDPWIFDIPPSVRQGNIIRISIRKGGDLRDGATAQLGEKSVSLFRQEAGEYLGLVPVRVNEPPGKRTLAIKDARGDVIRTFRVEILSAGFPRQNIRVTRKMKALKPMPGEMKTIRDLQNTVSEKRFWTEPFRSPTPGCMTSVFGVLRFHNGKFTGNYHRGVDLRSPAGRPVGAITAGVVKIARIFRLHGGTVGLDHGQGVISIYIHLSRIDVQEGELLRQGDEVGSVGSTGFATGPHVHWGLYVNGLPVNPAQWIPGVPRCR